MHFKLQNFCRPHKKNYQPPYIIILSKFKRHLDAMQYIKLWLKLAHAHCSPLYNAPFYILCSTTVHNVCIRIVHYTSSAVCCITKPNKPRYIKRYTKTVPTGKNHPAAIIKKALTQFCWLYQSQPQKHIIHLLYYHYRWVDQTLIDSLMTER